MSYVCAGKKFKSLGKAKAFAELLFKSKGVVAGIESTQERELIAARIQGAINGLQIPMMSIPALYRAMEAAIAAGKTQEELRAVAAGFPGVKESA